MTKKHRKDKHTWIVTLDGARAHFYEMEKTQERLRLTGKGGMHGTRRLTQQLVSDRPGHTHDSMGSGRHAMEPRTDAHQHAEAEFTDAVARELMRDGSNGLFDELIVVADPRSLGALRKDLDKHFQDKYVALEIARDWSKMSASEVADHLRPHLDGAKLH